MGLEVWDLTDSASDVPIEKAVYREEEKKELTLSE